MPGEKVFGAVMETAWREQLLKEALDWFEATGTKLSKEQKDAYRAGYYKAWGDLRNALSMHGYIKTR